MVIRKYLQKVICSMIVMLAPLVASVAAYAVSSAKPIVESTVTERGVAISASARLEAPFAVIWTTLTDYDHLAEFIPGMTASRTVTRCDGTAIVAQTGSAGSLLFDYPIDIIVQSEEHPPTGISVHILSGNLRTFEGGYTIEPVAGATDTYILGWRGIVDPVGGLPRLVTAWALRRSLATEFRAMVGEINRREALRRQGSLTAEFLPPPPCTRAAQAGRTG